MSKSTPYFSVTKTESVVSSTEAILAFAQRVNADTATNLNTAAFGTVPIDGALTTNGTGWAINGNGIELTGPDALVRCSFSIHCGSVANRSNLRVQLALDGTNIGPIAAHGYIRDANGHQESSYAMGGFWVSMTTGQVITVESQQEAAGGTVSMQEAGTSVLLLERILNV